MNVFLHTILLILNMENKFGDSQKNHTNQQKLINVNKIAYF
jgi:hypothetical protein